MLAVAALVAGLFGTPRPAHSASAAATFSALEVSGHAGAGDVSLDPAFDVAVPASELARSSDQGAQLVGFGADGRRLFALTLPADGAFHVYVPLAVNLQQGLTRLTLSYAGAHAERDASGQSEGAAELISLDADHVIVAWDARAYPAIRVLEAPDRSPVGSGNGTSTYEQLSVDSRARHLYIEFSDGVRSFTRTYAIFGR